MSYLESNLIPGETLIYQTRLHWVVMIGHIVVGCLVLALPGALLLYYTHNHSELQNRELHLMQVAGAALILCGGIATERAVTTRRVVIKTGLTSRKTVEMLLNKVESIEVSETTWGRMLGFE